MTRDDRSLYLAFAGLLALLCATVGASFATAGPVSLALGLAVAGAKVAVIAGRFMGLSRDDGLTRLAGLVGFAFAAILVALMLLDQATRGAPAPLWPD